MQELVQQLQAIGVVPVVALSDVEQAEPLADALMQAALPCIEITFRSSVAARAIARLRQTHPDLLIGAGTVTMPEELQQACEAGAHFAVAPGCNPSMVRLAQERGLPFMPGVCTPSDIEAALSCGCQHLKFFPAVAAGGIPMLRSLYAPYRHRGIGFMPTGGVTPDNLAEWLTCPGVGMVGGTWIASVEHLSNGDYAGIQQRAVQAREVVQQARLWL